MPAKLTPSFKQAEYTLHHLQLNLHAEHLQNHILPHADVSHRKWKKTFDVRRNHTVKVVRAALQARPGQSKPTGLGWTTAAVRTNGSHFIQTVPSELRLMAEITM